MKKLKNVLSLFDGMSCAQLALSDIQYENYFSSEIDSNATRLTKHNFPNTILLGDVQNIKGDTLNLPIDLLVGGSPCQGFSVNGKKLNLQDDRSKLLLDYIRIRDEVKPKWWLLENVGTMKDWVKVHLDNLLGVEGKTINSNLFSAQNRNRIYWSNIPFSIPSTHRQISVNDILETNWDKSLLINPDKARSFYAPSVVNGVTCINPKKENGKQTYQQDRVYESSGRFPCLTATLGNRFNIIDGNGIIRRLSIREQARLQTIPDYYDFSPVSDLSASKAIGNGMTVDAIKHILSFITFDNEKK